jgi:predicted DNA-binding antitoxin AbrB/MazE fold protein
MKKVIDPGAQTKRRDDAGPVSVLLRGEDSPAAFLHSCRSQAAAAVSVKRRRWYTTFNNRSAFLPGAEAMAITVEAIYENGVLKPAEPLPLKEHEKVCITIRPLVSLARQTAGMIPWTGDAETLEAIVRDPAFGILESP